MCEVQKVTARTQTAGVWERMALRVAVRIGTRRRLESATAASKGRNFIHVEVHCFDGSWSTLQLIHCLSSRS